MTRPCVFLSCLFLLAACATTGPSSRTGGKEAVGIGDDSAVQSPPPEAKKRSNHQAEKKPAAERAHGPESQPTPVTPAERARAPVELVTTHQAVNATTRPPQPGAALELTLWIELLGDGESGGRHVAADHVFHSGDRVRLHLGCSARGHVSVRLIDRGGVANVLYPDPTKGGGDDTLRPGQDCVVPPPQRSLRFDQHPGTERLLILYWPEGAVAPNPVQEVATRGASAGGGGGVASGKGIDLVGSNEDAAYLTASDPTGQAVVLAVDLQHQ